jgi:hypothetical protein
MNDYNVFVSATVTNLCEERASSESAAARSAVEWVSTCLSEAGYWDPDIRVVSVECTSSGYTPMDALTPPATPGYTPMSSLVPARTTLPNGYVPMSAV